MYNKIQMGIEGNKKQKEAFFLPVSDFSFPYHLRTYTDVADREEITRGK